MNTIQRIINYFELIPEYTDTALKSSDFAMTLNHIIKLTKAKEESRFVVSGDRIIYITDIKFHPTDKNVRGKIYNIRKDIFPQIFNTDDDKVRDINAKESEGVIETTHFILSYSKAKLFLAYEYNHYGPRISDFVYYLQHFGLATGISKSCNYYPLTRDDLQSYKGRMNRFSFFLAKVHKDHISRIEQIDSELFSAIETASNISDAEYVTLYLKYDYQHLTATSKIKKIVNKLLDKLISDKSFLNVFDSLKVKAEDEKQNNKLKEFDLLNIWVRSEVKVEKKEKSRAIISADIFEKMANEFKREFGR